MIVSKNKIVAIEYSLKDGEGILLDSNRGFAPLEYLQGAGNIVPGLEQAMEGMQIGETKVVAVEAAHAFGGYEQALQKVLPAGMFKNYETINEGDAILLEDGTEAIVIKKENETLCVDANHPLAGVTLQYEVQVKGIRLAEADELLQGFPGPVVSGCSGTPGCC